MPTIRIQQFSDSFKGFTFIVEEKFQNEIKNVFMYDKSKALKNLTSNDTQFSTTTIIAKEGIVEEKKMVLFNGNIISTNKNNQKSNIVKFEQINIDLKNLKTGTIKQIKLQETPSFDLIRCIREFSKTIINCKENAKR